MSARYVGLAAVSAAALALVVAGCSGWTPARPFDREAPPVREAIVALDGGDAAAAAAKLEEYLSTGPCKDGSIGMPDVVKTRPDGTFDLGLSLFSIGEQFGRRFGEEEVDAGTSEATRAKRHAQVTCARTIVQAVADDRSVPAELRARANYLDGNLAFLDAEYESAVRAYDRALVMSPGEVDAGDPVGRDAAWNRAIAMQRIEDRKDAGTDGGPDGGSDGGHGDAGGQDGGGGGQDSGPDGASAPPDAGPDSGGDGGSNPPPDEPDAAPEPREASAPPPPSNEDERVLDQLESAPTLQQEQAKRARKRQVRGMVDK